MFDVFYKCHLMNLKFFILFFVCNFSFSAFAQQDSKTNGNTKLNQQQLKSRKSFVGKLNTKEYKELRNHLLNTLQIDAPEETTLVVHFFQKGINCLEYGLHEETGIHIINNVITISDRMSMQYNAKDFFVYTSDALNKNRFEEHEKFILDSGFFNNEIFTLKENCRAFFILKPDGSYMKYYGSDYFSEVEMFLKK